MQRIVPHQDTFDIARKREKVQDGILVASTALTIFSIVLNAVSTKSCWVYTAIEYLNILSSVFAVAYVVLDILINVQFYKGGREKRVDLVDHAYGTNFSGTKSSGYFNPGAAQSGTYKLAILGFENSLFSSEISRRMTPSKWGTALIITAIFIVSAAVGNKTLVNNILQITATGVLIQQAVKLQQYADRMTRIHEDFKSLFSDLKNLSDKTVKEGEMIRNILNYETTNSWGSILLDSKLFNQLNPNLSIKWEQIKQNYDIQ